MDSDSPIRQALETRLAAIVGLPSTGGKPDIAFENVRFDPKNKARWIRSRLKVTEERERSIGQTAPIKHSGVFLVDCFIDPDQYAGPKAADDLAGLITAAFRRKTIIQGGVRVVCQYAERQEGIDDSPWYFVPVTITWFCYS